MTPGSYRSHCDNYTQRLHRPVAILFFCPSHHAVPFVTSDLSLPYQQYVVSADAAEIWAACPAATMLARLQ